MACAEKTLPEQASTSTGTRRASARTRRSCPGPPDSGLDQGLALGGLADSLDETEVEDCRWTPCFDCGVCPAMQTEIQVGPTGKKLLAALVVK